MRKTVEHAPIARRVRAGLTLISVVALAGGMTQARADLSQTAGSAVPSPLASALFSPSPSTSGDDLTDGTHRTVGDVTSRIGGTANERAKDLSGTAKSLLGQGSTTKELGDTGDPDPAGTEKPAARSAARPRSSTPANSPAGEAVDVPAYTRMTGRAAVAAARNALRLLGPLGIPVAVAAMIFVLLLSSAVGYRGIVRVEGAPMRRAYRL